MLTVIAGFPAISAVFDSIKIELNQAQIICTQTINNSVISSAPVVINLQYLQNVEVKEVDQGNITVIPSKTNVVYVECIKNNNGTCLGRNKMLICEAEANPTPTHSDYTWWQNGQFLNSGKRLIVNSTMSGSAIQCGVSTSFLYSRVMSSVFMIQAYAPAHLLHVAKIDESLTLKCALEGASSLNAVWRMRRPNGLVTTAPCSRSTDQNLPTTSYHRSVIKNSLNRKLATCELHITDDSYTGQYWCCAIDSLSDCLQNPQDKRIAEVEVQRADFDIETTIQSK